MHFFKSSKTNPMKKISLKLSRGALHQFELKHNVVTISIDVTHLQGI